MAKGKLPSITSSIPNDLRRFLDRVREFIDSADVSSTTTSGSGRTSTVGGTKTVSSSVISSANTAPKYTVTPANLIALGQSGAVLLLWDTPADENYARTEIWRSTTNDRTTASRIAVSIPSQYTDTTPTAGTYYYWIRFINIDGDAGAFNSISGTEATSTGAGGEQARSASGYLYYGSSSSSAPSAPTASSYDFDTNTFGSVTSNWSLTFTVPDIQGTYWAVRYNVVEDTYGGAQTVTLTPVFKWQNMDGLVTFTNLATATDGLITGSEVNTNVTSIDGGVITTGTINGYQVNLTNLNASNITTGSITADRLTTGTINQATGFGTKIGLSTYVDGLGATWTLGGLFSRSGNGLGPALYVNDTSSSPSTYAFGVGANTGGAAVFKDGGAAGNNCVQIYANNTDGIRMDHYGSGYGLRIYQGSGIYTTGANYFYNASGGGTTLNCYNNNGAHALYCTAGGTSGSYVAYYSGSRPEAQLYCTAYGSGSTVHSARFKHTTSGASLICATASGYAAYLESGGVGSFTGAHDALVLKTDSFEAGDIIVDVAKAESQGVSDCIFTGEKSTAANQAAIGIYVSRHTFDDQIPAPFKDFENQYTEEREVEYTETPDEETTEVHTRIEEDLIVPSKASLDNYITDYDVAIINALGEGAINVCGENGDIAVGDLIVTSNTVGKGMKQADDLVRSYTVARAREAVTFANATDTAQIACVYLCG